MKYCEVVRDIAAKQGNWRYYDKQFRFLRQSKPDRYPWDNVAWELWHQALHSSLTTSQPSCNNDFRTRRPNQRPFQSKTDHFKTFRRGGEGTGQVQNINSCTRKLGGGNSCNYHWHHCQP